MEIDVNGPVLLLIGPIGNFFSRFAKFLIKNDITVHKINFPLKEIFFAKKCRQHYYDDSPENFGPYIRAFYKTHQIKQLYISADFYNIHQIAIAEARKLGIDAYVFELGYIRPHYVTLEKERVNARSNLNKPSSFYKQLPIVDVFPTVKHKPKYLWRKIFLPFCFVLQTFCRYRIIDDDHKSQPKPIYILNQILGTIRKPLYFFTEHKIKRQIEQLPHHFFVPLQVDTDSQITLSSKYTGMLPFIDEVLGSFALNAATDDYLVFKHHPADRGYNNYKQHIHNKCTELGISSRVFYVHDMKLGQLFKQCKGVITVNSTVGLNALHANLPTKVMGETFYDIDGLTAQGSLDAFWLEQYQIDRELYDKFYVYMINTTQINGSFHGYFNFDGTFRFAAKALCQEEDKEEELQTL